jgi:hypothetical protein
MKRSQLPISHIFHIFDNIAQQANLCSKVASVTRLTTPNGEVEPFLVAIDAASCAALRRIERLKLLDP